MDPVRVGRAECDAWVAYYRRDWPKMLAGALGMVRHGFALGPVRDLRAAWHVLRANQAWAPFPDNDPAAARLSMARFYQLTVDAGRLDDRSKGRCGSRGRVGGTGTGWPSTTRRWIRTP